MDTSSQNFFDKNYKFEKDKEKDLLGTLYTNPSLYSSMDGWSKEGMIEYNKLCLSVRDEKLMEENSIFEDWFYGVMQGRRHKSSEERKRILNE